MDWMRQRDKRPNRSDLSRHCEMAGQPIPQQCSISSFNWPEATSFVKGKMRSSKWLLSLLCLALTSVALCQDGDPPVKAAQPEQAPAPEIATQAPTAAGSFDQVMD